MDNNLNMIISLEKGMKIFRFYYILILYVYINLYNACVRIQSMDTE